MEFWIPSLYEKIFDWAGLAIQEAADSQETFRCDYYIAFMDGGVFTDRFSTVNGRPPLDTDLGGTNDITSDRRYEGNYLIQSLTRKLQTGDEYDVQFRFKRAYELKWALGPIIDGIIEQHSLRYMGYEFFLMIDDYQDKNDDDRRRFGPWHEKDLTGIPNFNSEKAKEERAIGPELKALRDEAAQFEGLQFNKGLATEFLVRGMSVAWDTSVPEEITLDIFIPHWTAKDYHYVIFQFQPSYLPQDEYVRDSYYADLPNGVLVDGFTKTDGAKHTDDVLLGGTNDITSTVEVTDTLIHYTITRKMKTGDAFDIDFVYDQAYQVEWTLGRKDEKGNFLPVPWDDYGYEYFALFNSYEDRNRDERGHFGEFYKYAAPEASKVENRRVADYEWSKALDVRFSERFKQVVEDISEHYDAGIYTSSGNDKTDMVSLIS
eukprot:CAMPEP_0202945804 /NCGR_PEP_ID=MMETSP1395-20130829/7311_1 /ASSEMBLY_ACC=CAM_ASM_000871 /TAXON_ID=5961 /ORGANISM="Blepharisma japonicum, Strain Stock R1072" /LENGTH=431 /DNA_ID=CAMNT_0049646067 /DNA_START=104 /DNA_END=1399 /DNA_ORIENTATION=-